MSEQIKLFEDASDKQDVKNYLSLDNLVTRVKLGEVWKLGEHRLMCGDACKREDIELLLNGRKPDLILQDPPYGNGKYIQHKDGGVGGNTTLKTKHQVIRDKYTPPHHLYPIVLNNNNQDVAWLNYEIVKELSSNQIIWGGNYFVDFLPVSRCWIIWDKMNTGEWGDGELAWTSLNKAIKLYRFMWNGCVRHGTNKLNPKPRVHPTQKPVELHIKILQDFSKQGDLVLDCFGGSGTTLIACNECGRVCYMMELSPEYCEIIIRRWEVLTGAKAERAS